MIDRRGFLGSMLATIAAPAVVHAASLMPVAKIWVPSQEIIVPTLETLDVVSCRGLSAIGAAIMGKYYGEPVVSQFDPLGQRARLFLPTDAAGRGYVESLYVRARAAK